VPALMGFADQLACERERVAGVVVELDARHAVT
jgi:hypothetical protein